MRSGHPLTHGPVTKDRLFAFPFVVVELTGGAEQDDSGFFIDRGVARRVWIDRLLIDVGDGGEGLVARVAVTVPHYAAIPPMVRLTDMVATLPRRLAVRAAERDHVVILDLPYEPLQVTVEAIWHKRGEKDSGMLWLIREIVDAGIAEAGTASA